MPTAEWSARETGDEYTDLEEAETSDKTKKGGRKKSSSAPKPPTLQAQMAALLQKVDNQAARTDQLYSMIQSQQNLPDGRVTQASRQSTSQSRSTGHKSSRKHVISSHAKKRSPQNGRSRRHRPSGATSYRSGTPSTESLSPGSSDVESQVCRALDMLQPKFSRHKGNCSEPVDRVKNYRPFAFLEREEQRRIIKNGHPEELTMVQHLSGICAMAIEEANERSDVYGLLSHALQILQDYGYIQWATIRSFSNSVFANIAKGKWSWADDRLIERCRNNQYMRHGGA